MSSEKDEFKGLHGLDLIQELNPHLEAELVLDKWKKDPAAFIQDVFGIKPAQWQIDCFNAISQMDSKSIAIPFAKRKYLHRPQPVVIVVMAISLRRFNKYLDALIDTFPKGTEFERRTGSLIIDGKRYLYVWQMDQVMGLRNFEFTDAGGGTVHEDYQEIYHYYLMDKQMRGK